MPTTHLPKAAGVRFAPIAGFLGYAVGDDGSVWTCRGYHGELKPVWRKKKPYVAKTIGYLCVNLRCGLPGDRQYRSFTVHRLVLEAFVGKRPDGAVCRHLNGNRLDPRLSNLCWGTQAENAGDTWSQGRGSHGSRHPIAKLTDADIREVFARRRKGQSQASIARHFGVNQSSISRICRRRRWARSIPVILGECA